MYEEVNSFDFKCFLKSNSSASIEIEILKTLDYDLVIQYDDFLEMIHNFSKDIHNEVAEDVLESWKRLC